MGTVWRAEDPLLGRNVALKVLDPTLAKSAEARKRFQHEARAVALLDHPAIVPVYDHGEADGDAFIVMALVEGETLSARMSRGLVPLADVVRIGDEIGCGLGFAHARGVLHRDVTPRNLMWTRDDRVVLLDFGLALVEGMSRVTRSGTAVGTLLYMSPEAIQGGNVDARSDLYSLGAVLYELMTGSPPHYGDQTQSLIYAKLNVSPRPPSSLRPEIGGDLEALVLRLLDRDPARRFPDAGAWIRAWRGIGSGGSTAALREPRPAAIAEAMAENGVQVYLALPAFEVEDASEALATLARSLADALRRRLASMRRLHVVPAIDRPAADEARAWSRRAGANMMLLGRVRQAGERVRVECTLIDPESGTALAGEAVDGTPWEPFEFEDRLVTSVQRLFPMQNESWREEPRAAYEPAAEDRFAQAVVYLQRHDHEPSVDAAVALLERLAADPDAGADAHATLGRALLAKYQLTKQHAWEARAAQAIERAASRNAGLPVVRLALADLQALTGRESQAVALYDALVGEVPDFFEAWLGLARLHRDHSRFSEAERACRRAIDLRPADWRGHNTLGQTYVKAGRFAEAAASWHRVRRLVPGSALAARNLGVALYHLDRFEEAAVAFRDSITIEPSARAYASLGTALYILERFPEAVDAFERAVALRPEDPKLWGNLGNACRFIEGRQDRVAEALDRAIGLMREALRRNPDDGDGWALLAGWLQARGHADEARGAIARAMAIAPHHPRTMVEAAHLCVQQQDHDGAMTWLHRAVAAGHGVGELMRSRELRVLAPREDFQRLIRGGQDGRAPEPTQGRS